MIDGDTMTVAPLDWQGFVRVWCGNVTATLTVAQAARMASEYASAGGEVEWLVK
jgi:hypothetical protein